jgi:hypothetical protein
LTARILFGTLRFKKTKTIILGVHAQPHVYFQCWLDNKMVKKHLAHCPLCGNELEIERA